MSVRVLYSLKLKVAPHPYQKLVPLNALLPVILQYPLNIFILSLKANRIKKSSMNNVTFYIKKYSRIKDFLLNQIGG